MESKIVSTESECCNRSTVLVADPCQLHRIITTPRSEWLVTAGTSVANNMCEANRPSNHRSTHRREQHSEIHFRCPSRNMPLSLPVILHLFALPLVVNLLPFKHFGWRFSVEVISLVCRINVFPILGVEFHLFEFWNPLEWNRFQ